MTGLPFSRTVWRIRYDLTKENINGNLAEQAYSVAINVDLLSQRGKRLSPSNLTERELGVKEYMSCFHDSFAMYALAHNE